MNLEYPLPGKKDLTDAGQKASGSNVKTLHGKNGYLSISKITTVMD